MRREISRQNIEPRTRRILGRRLRSRTIPVDVREDGDEFVILSSLPGYSRRDIRVSAKGPRIAITVDAAVGGEMRRFGSRSDRDRRERTVELPERIDEHHVSAEYIDGVLTVRAPKWHRPRRSRSVTSLRRRVDGARSRLVTDGGSEDESEPGTDLLVFDPTGTDLLDEWLPDELRPSERDEEIQSYEARIDDEMARQQEFKTDKSGKPYRGR